MPPSEVTQSAITSAPTSCAAAQMALPGWYTPVEVSACTYATTARFFPQDKLARLRVLEHRAPGLFKPHHFGALPAGHLGDTLAEEAVHEDGELPTRLGEVADSGLHAGGTRAGKRHVELVLRGKNQAQEPADLARNLEKEGIQVAYHGLAESLVDARSHHARAGAQQQPLGRA